ncbi:hypothetical protein EGW08_003452 [Elysia chlorotica]|uniref:Uncharacterized protein n=1 Tax=Elysia chlorotica TaxID=188477 RepID=A0A3S1AD39_ELYCH|nr:hypothetical protein EGW08_003452 [Elysia chlorotica]
MAPTEGANGRLASTWDSDSASPSPPQSPRNPQKSAPCSPKRDPLELSLSLQDLDNTCEIYFCGWDTSLSPPTSTRHLTVPEASADFKRAMVTPEHLEKPHLSRTPSPTLPPVTACSRKSACSTSRSLSSSRTPSPMSLSPPPLSPTWSSSVSSLCSSSLLSSSPSSPSTPSSSPKPTLKAALSLVLSPLKAEKTPKRSRSKPWQGGVFLPSIVSSSDSITPGPLATRRPASFGDADGVKYRNTHRRASHGEKHVSWADEFGSTSKLTSVRLIRPRLDAADSKKSGAPTPGRSILRDTGAN